MDMQQPAAAPTLKPDDRITVELTAQQWNVVLGCLSDAPYRIAAPLMHEIQRQCMTQTA